MGSSQSTTSSRAAKFSGTNTNRRSVRSVRSAPATELNSRRATSCRNTNRSVKEFSKFWSDAGPMHRTKSTNRGPTKRQGQPNGGSVRRKRTQSVDVRRASSCAPASVNSVNEGNGHIQHIKTKTRKASSFRAHTSASPSTLSADASKMNSKSISGKELSPHFGKSEIYSAEFNQAAIAAARLKRLSLTPHPTDSRSQVWSSTSSVHHSPNRYYNPRKSSTTLKPAETVIY